MGTTPFTNANWQNAPGQPAADILLRHRPG
jgi:hypothetical protein